MPYPPASIDSMYNGPINCGNGGYISGLLASYIEGDAEVRINAAFPVATPLQVEDSDAGIGVYLDGKLLGSARPVKLELNVPAPVDRATAQAAGQRFDFIHSSAPEGCYVCSPSRTEDNGLRVFCGAIKPADGENADALEQNIVAALWRPNENLGNDDGKVDNIYVWSALDCPGAYAIKAAEPDAGLQLLGTCSGSIKAPLNTGEEYILTSWKVEANKGRKRIMGVAIHSTDGELMACAKQIWIDVGDALPAAV
ncbi:MAG: hypothetical protein KBT88_09750 [Gammaproteobacteria bacterium]|nr:hypothetical protein [Gammaproteobacteria bacterium]MBQ0840058.1 hypothetical protein [Gammaproteobacteria bacterium]